MNVHEETWENERDENEPAPIVIRKLDKIETTDWPMSQGASN